jgi:hypothetical protein
MMLIMGDCDPKRWDALSKSVLGSVTLSALRGRRGKRGWQFHTLAKLKSDLLL